MATDTSSVKQAKREATKARIEAAKAKAEAAKARASALSGGRAAGFLNFIREQGVVGLAVGLAVGTAAGASVKSLVDNFISPIVGFILGGTDLSGLVWKTGLSHGGKELTFGWGAIVSSLITLTATAFVVYLVIHGARLDRIDKKKG
jgi:large conductance mechanosensitive channel protein